MKTIKYVIFLGLLTCQLQGEENNMIQTHHTVVAIVEAKPGKEEALKQALAQVVAPSRAEPACIEYRLHQDATNPAVFILYENWKSKELHAQQFQKPYIIELAQKLGDLLAKPYQGFFADEIEKQN